MELPVGRKWERLSNEAPMRKIPENCSSEHNLYVVGDCGADFRHLICNVRIGWMIYFGLRVFFQIKRMQCMFFIMKRLRVDSSWPRLALKNLSLITFPLLVYMTPEVRRAKGLCPKRLFLADMAGIQHGKWPKKSTMKFIALFIDL